MNKKRKAIVRKNLSYSFMRKFYREFEDNPEFILKKMRGYVGEYDMGTQEIFIDYRRELLPTLIHEYLHKWNENKSETWVLRQERKIVNALSVYQIKKILKLFSAFL